MSTSFLSGSPFPASLPRLFSMASGAGLLLLGVYPNQVFALLWISPLLILVSLQALLQEIHIFSPLTDGDWRFVLTSALAALVCGFFWEMWNCYSLAKWVYHVPFVQRFHIFEMPILGYAGVSPVPDWNAAWWRSGCFEGEAEESRLRRSVTTP